MRACALKIAAAVGVSDRSVAAPRARFQNVYFQTVVAGLRREIVNVRFIFKSSRRRRRRPTTSGSRRTAPPSPRHQHRRRSFSAHATTTTISRHPPKRPLKKRAVIAAAVVVVAGFFAVLATPQWTDVSRARDFYAGGHARARV